MSFWDEAWYCDWPGRATAMREDLKYEAIKLISVSAKAYAASRLSPAMMLMIVHVFVVHIRGMVERLHPKAIPESGDHFFIGKVWHHRELGVEVALATLGRRPQSMPQVCFAKHTQERLLCNFSQEIALLAYVAIRKAGIDHGVVCRRLHANATAVSPNLQPFFCKNAPRHALRTAARDSLAVPVEVSARQS